MAMPSVHPSGMVKNFNIAHFSNGIPYISVYKTSFFDWKYIKNIRFVLYKGQGLELDPAGVVHTHRANISMIKEVLMLCELENV